MLFGGFDDSPQTGSLLGDTWEWDGVRWTQSVVVRAGGKWLGNRGYYIDAEAVTVLAELATRRLIEAAESGTNEGGNA